MTSVKERFLKYVKIDTKSNTEATGCPSTPGQFVFARQLVEEMRTLGLEDINLDENGYIMATLPANTSKKIPVIGFIAHMDTSPEMNGEGVNPQIIPSYDGGEIVLNKELNLKMTPDIFPELKKYTGQELITTDGNTLLGADDKAGVAAILTAVEYLIKHPEIQHGKIRVGFTPDEEISRGADLFDVAKFGAEYAYTVDGGEVGELEYETFNAAQGVVIVNGKNVHPGVAKNKMLNSIQVSMEFNAMLPVSERPEFTEGVEGFFHIMHMEASVELTKMIYIIRDHNRAIFEERKVVFLSAADFLNKKYGAGTLDVRVKDTYYNMREKIEPVFHIVELASDAMKSLGITPIIVPVRGGTDGSRLSYMGLPCPNLFTGGLYAHGRYECIPTRSLEKAVDVVVKIAEMTAQK
ncbi:MAG: tripeptide aminopeptidase [Chloroflexi bacterium]|nr:MAG: tripeptide aminopeptidase [Chloroflexota bacterium]MBA4375037.1 peptidase T [Anaerolinea sp.]